MILTQNQVGLLLDAIDRYWGPQAPDYDVDEQLKLLRASLFAVYSPDGDFPIRLVAEERTVASWREELVVALRQARSEITDNRTSAGSYFVALEHALRGK